MLSPNSRPVDAPNSDHKESCDQTIKESQSSTKSSTETKDDTPKKPAFSYNALIIMALKSSPDKKLTLHGIYNYIKDNYPYYRTTTANWKSSIRGYLSTYKWFVKVKRAPGEKEYGCYWMLVDNYEDQMLLDSKRRRRAPIEPRSVDAPTKSPTETDDSTPKKPDFSYNVLIIMAIKNSPEKRLTVKEIYAYIQDAHPFYRTTTINWKKSICHHLSTYKWFVKVERGPYDKGNNSCWMLNVNCEEEILLDRRGRVSKAKESGGKASAKPPRGDAPTNPLAVTEPTKPQGGTAPTTPLDVDAPIEPHGVDATSNTRGTDGPTMVPIYFPMSVLSPDSFYGASAPVPLVDTPKSDSDKPSDKAVEDTRSSTKSPIEADGSTPKKPNFSYKGLIIMAIRNSPEKRLTLQGIYRSIQDAHPFYRTTNINWKNCIRYSLSINKWFVKVKRNPADKCARYWMLVESYEDEILLDSKEHRRSSRTKSGTAPTQPQGGIAPTIPLDVDAPIESHGVDAPSNTRGVDAPKKPNFSYNSLIILAIKNSPEKRLTLEGIYTSIQDAHPFYCTTSIGWKNAIRYNLSSHNNKWFVKVEQNPADKSACYWMLDDNYKNEMLVDRRGRCRASRAKSSGGKATTTPGGVDAPLSVMPPGVDAPTSPLGVVVPIEPRSGDAPTTSLDVDAPTTPIVVDAPITPLGVGATTMDPPFLPPTLPFYPPNGFFGVGSPTTFPPYLPPTLPFYPPNAFYGVGPALPFIHTPMMMPPTNVDLQVQRLWAQQQSQQQWRPM